MLVWLNTFYATHRGFITLQTLMFLVLLTEVDHWKEEGDDTSAPPGEH